MIREFFVTLAVIVFSTILIVLHYMTHPGEVSTTEINNIVQATKMTSPSLSVAYYEPRSLFENKAKNPAYPQMIPINRMDFVYAQ